MIRPELKALFIPDYPLIDHPFEPDDPHSFGIEVVAFIGAERAEESEGFHFTWCTPRWLDRRFESETGVELLRAHAFTPRWTPTAFAELEDRIRSLCNEIQAPDWGLAASRLGRWFDWEMQYRYDAALDAGERYE
jgi:hypothetical protein